MSKYWQNWLSIWAAVVIIFGLVFVGAGFAPTDGATRLFYTLLGNPLPDEIDFQLRFAIGLIGAVTLGWGLTYHVAFKALHMLDAVKAAPLWRSLALFALVWYVVDSWISIANGFWLNAVSNTFLTILLLIPILKSGAMKG